MDFRRRFPLFLWHAMFLVVAPYVLLLGLLAFCFNILVPFFIYCAPAAFLFPNHFRAHAAIWPENGLEWALLVLVYLGLAFLSAMLHALIRDKKGQQPKQPLRRTPVKAPSSSTEPEARRS